MAPRKSKTNTVPNAGARSQVLKSVLANDSYQNLMGRMGAGTTNITEGSTYVMTRITRNYYLMNTLYRNSWLVRKICDTIPKDMLKNWIHFEGDKEPDELALLDKVITKTRLKKSLLTGMEWGRLYGGAAGLIMLEGQDDLEEPLDIDAVMPGDYKGLTIVDRWSGVYPQLELVDDISSPEFGLPKYYQFQEPNNQRDTLTVHHSRIIRFVGDDLPNWEQQAEVYWGASKIEAMYEDLKRRDSSAANIAGLIFMANLRILKMADLGELLGGGVTQKALEDFYNTISAQNALMSNFGIQVLSKEDDFQSVQLSNFKGLNDVYESFMLDISGATGIPVSKLFGRSPAGMNATGEQETQNYYDMIAMEQEACLAPMLDKLMPVLLMSTYGELPEITYEFNPVYEPTPQEEADLLKNKSETLLAVHDRGIISDRTVLLELQALGEGTGMFTNITDADIQAANDQPANSQAGDALDETMDEPVTSGITDNDFVEPEHPRDPEGKFTSGGSGGSATPTIKVASGFSRSKSAGGKSGERSKSEYVQIEVNGKKEELRISDHWYIKGDSTGRGAAGKYTDAMMENYMEDRTAIKLKEGLYLTAEGSELIFTTGRKMTNKQAANIIQSPQFAEAFAALVEGDENKIAELNKKTGFEKKEKIYSLRELQQEARILSTGTYFAPAKYNSYKEAMEYLKANLKWEP